MTDTTAPRTAAGRALLDLVYTLVGRHLAADAPADWRERITPEWAARILAIEAEAIEPLLALVRALEAAKIPHLVVDGDCWYSCGLAVDPYDGEPACCNDEERGRRCTCGASRHNGAIDRALAALPESVRVAARKPE